MTTATKYKSYSKYKPSGIDWLGDIPEGWEIWKYGHLFLSSMGETILREDLVDDGKIPVYSATEENINFGYVNSASVILDKGDLVIPARGNSIGNVKLVDKLSTTTQTTIYSKLIKKNKTDIRYVLYLLKGLKPVYFFFDRTAIPQITVDQVQNNDLCIPSIKEQKSIADFLDRETAKIDEMVVKKQRMMELLKEKCQALITHAVTKGLDPKAKMKLSGIDWLGDIPKEWEALPLKRAVGIKITDGPHETPEILDDGINFISAEAVKNGKIDFELRRGFISKELHQLYSKKCKPRKNDIFLIKSGATTGNIAIVETDFEFSIWSPLALIRADEKKAQYKFLFYSLLSKLFHDQVEFSWSYGTQQNIGMGVIENLIITLPPYSLQKKIADYIDHETSQIDEMMKKVETQIEKLQEYRQALITSAVTGKIMVS